MNAAPVAGQVVWLLHERGLTLATAESLTGGLIGKLLTDVPGASAVYRGGVVSYATELKHLLLGVSNVTLEAVGPVAAETAEQMARGAAERCRATFGVAVTGVAGPEFQDGHPIGQVFLAVVSPQRGISQVKELRLSGGRAQIRSAAALEALRLVADVLDSDRLAGR